MAAAAVCTARCRQQQQQQQHARYRATVHVRAAPRASSACARDCVTLVWWGNKNRCATLSPSAPLAHCPGRPPHSQRFFIFSLSGAIMDTPSRAQSVSSNGAVFTPSLALERTNRPQYMPKTATSGAFVGALFVTQLVAPICGALIVDEKCYASLLECIVRGIRRQS